MSTSSLNNQFLQVLKSACAIGTSKQAYREEFGSKKTDKIFSYSTFDSIRDTSISLCSFLSTNYPGIKKISEISSEHLQEFLEYKSFNCNDNTLEKTRQHLISLGLYASKKFKSVDFENWKVSYVPSGTRPNNIKIQNGFSDQEVYSLIAYASAPRRTNLLNGILLAATLGLRIDEIYTQQKSDFHLNKPGDFGFGYVNVSDPKHGRKRHISIPTEFDHQKLMDMLKTCTTDKIITCSKSNLHRRLADAKKACNISCFGQSWHSIRKNYAQNFYNFYRMNHSRTETIDKTNEYLGHGRKQEQKLKTYVNNMW